jgi:hypothetical protein
MSRYWSESLETGGGEVWVRCKGLAMNYPRPASLIQHVNKLHERTGPLETDILISLSFCSHTSPGGPWGPRVSLCCSLTSPGGPRVGLCCRLTMPRRSPMSQSQSWLQGPRHRLESYGGGSFANRAPQVEWVGPQSENLRVSTIFQEGPEDTLF